MKVANAWYAALLLTASAFTTHTRLQRAVASQRRHRESSRVQATMILGGGEDDEDKPKLTRETEPDQYFASNFETLSAQDKLKDPLVIIGLLSIFFPFALLIVFNNMGLLGN